MSIDLLMAEVVDRWRSAAQMATSHSYRELSGQTVAWWFDKANANTLELMSALGSDPAYVVPGDVDGSRLTTQFLQPNRPMGDTLGSDTDTIREWIAQGCPIPSEELLLESEAKRTEEQMRALPTTEEEMEAFYKLVNIEQYPEFRDKAREYAYAYLAAADYNASPFYNEFEYNETDFHRRMKDIYNSYVDNTMYNRHFYDREIVEVAGKRYPIGRASDKVVIDNLVQKAPFNYLDGVWLQNIMTAQPSDEVKSKLFDIWADEVGNGEVEQNHANVYENLLRSNGIYLPLVTSREFIDYPFTPGSWRTAVFQMCVGWFPQEFFPELLGLTLFLEWEATPTLTPTVRMMRGRGIDPLFYQLHVAIDNISEGHGALAVEAVVAFLNEQRQEGGEVEVQRNWKRIWNGYVTWATAGFLGTDVLARRLIIDKKRVNLGTPEEPDCYPDLKTYYREQMVGLVERKADAAKQVHRGATVDGKPLNGLFDVPEELLDALVADGWVDPVHPRDSRFMQLLKFEGPMYRVFSEDDQEVVLNWIESLDDRHYDCIEPLPDTGVDGWPEKMVDLISRHAVVAKLAHDGIVLSTGDGATTQLSELFDSPIDLMKALIASGWIVPGNSARSFFLIEILGNGGPMNGVFSADDIEIVDEWIKAGAEVPNEERVLALHVVTADVDREYANTMREFALKRPLIGMGAVH